MRVSLLLCRVGRAAAVHGDQDGLEACRGAAARLGPQRSHRQASLPRQRTALLPPGNGPQRTQHVHNFHLVFFRFLVFAFVGSSMPIGRGKNIELH